MMLNRRGFFSAIAGLAAVAAVDPEKLLWVPGRKLISISRPSIYDGPFRVIPFPREIGGDEDHAKVFEGLLNYRWNTEPAFRRLARNASDMGVLRAFSSIRSDAGLAELKASIAMPGDLRHLPGGSTVNYRPLPFNENGGSW